MQHTFRFFARTVDARQVLFDADECLHLQVVRAVPGDELEVGDGQGQVYRCRLCSLTRHAARAEILAVQHEPRPPLTFAAALGVQSGAKFEQLLRSLTELGVTRFLIFKHQHDAHAKIGTARLPRWRKIIISASKQCKRAWLPEITLLPDWGELIKTLEKDFTFRLALKQGGDYGLSDVLSWSPHGGACMVVGAACGFSEDEVAALHAVPVRFIDLGSCTLRAETAAVFFAGFVAFWQREKLP